MMRDLHHYFEGKCISNKIMITYGIVLRNGGCSKIGDNAQIPSDHSDEIVNYNIILLNLNSFLKAIFIILCAEQAKYTVVK